MNVEDDPLEYDPREAMRFPPSARMGQKVTKSERKRRQRARGGDAGSSSAGQKPPEPPPKKPVAAEAPRRWPLYAGVAAVVALTIAGVVYLFSRKTPEKEIPDKILDIVVRHGGDVVSNKTNGAPDTNFTLLKQFHGGTTNIGKIVADQKYAQDFLGHHAAVTRTVIDGMRASDKGFVLLEGLRGSPSEWSPAVHEALKTIALLEETAAQHPERAEELRHRANEIYLRQARAAVASGDVAQAMAIMHNVVASYRIAAICLYTEEGKKNGWDRKIMGFDIPGGPNLSAGTMGRIKDLVEQLADPTDAQIANFIDWYKEAVVTDTKMRHTYGQELCEREVPKGSDTYIVIGGTHVGSGIRAEEARLIEGTVPLEDQLLQIDNSRVIAVDPRGYDAMNQFFQAHEKVMGHREMTNPAMVKEMIMRMREQALRKKRLGDRSRHNPLNLVPAGLAFSLPGIGTETPHRSHSLDGEIAALAQEFSPSVRPVSDVRYTNATRFQPSDVIAPLPVDVRFRADGDVTVSEGCILLETAQGRPVEVPKTLVGRLGGELALQEAMRTGNLSQEHQVEIRPLKMRNGSATLWLLVIGGTEVCVFLTDVASTGGVGTLTVRAIQALSAIELLKYSVAEAGDESTVIGKTWRALRSLFVRG